MIYKQLISRNPALHLNMMGQVTKEKTTHNPQPTTYPGLGVCQFAAVWGWALAIHQVTFSLEDIEKSPSQDPCGSRTHSKNRSSAALLNVDIKSGQEFGSSSAHCLMTNEKYRTFPSKTLGKWPLVSAMSLVIVPENNKNMVVKESLCELAVIRYFAEMSQVLTMYAPLILFCS